MVYPPSLISRKFARRGVTVPVLMVRRDPDTPSHHTMQARARAGADGMKRESRLPFQSTAYLFREVAQMVSL